MNSVKRKCSGSMDVATNVMTCLVLGPFNFLFLLGMYKSSFDDVEHYFCVIFILFLFFVDSPSLHCYLIYWHVMNFFVVSTILFCVLIWSKQKKVCVVWMNSWLNESQSKNRIRSEIDAESNQHEYFMILKTLFWS